MGSEIADRLQALEALREGRESREQSAEEIRQLAEGGGPFYLVGMDVNLYAEPCLAGLYGPFRTVEEAQAYRLRVEESGTRLVLTGALDPESYP